MSHKLFHCCYDIMSNAYGMLSDKCHILFIDNVGKNTSSIFKLDFSFNFSPPMLYIGHLPFIVKSSYQFKVYGYTAMCFIFLPF